MRRKLIIDGNAVYEIDDECVLRKEAQRQQAVEWQTTGRQLQNSASGGEKVPTNSETRGAPNEKRREQEIRFY